MTPEFRIEADDKDITHLLNDRLISMSVTDEVADQSDKLRMQIGDAENRINIPVPGVKLRVWLGYEGQALKHRGAFMVDEVEIGGPPTEISVTARAIDMNSAIKAPRTKTWDVPLVDIARTIAKYHNLVAVIGSGIAKIALSHQNQVSESDLNFLTRIAELNDIAIKISNGQLRLAYRGVPVQLDGIRLNSLLLRPQDVTSWQYKIEKREQFQSVTAKWHDVRNATTNKVSAGSGEPSEELRDTYASESEAREAAQARLNASTRGERTLDLDTVGRGDLYAGAPLELSGIHPGIDGVWIAKRVVHSLSSSGYTCSVEAEPGTTTQ